MSRHNPEQSSQSSSLAAPDENIESVSSSSDCTIEEADDDELTQYGFKSMEDIEKMYARCRGMSLYHKQVPKTQHQIVTEARMMRDCLNTWLHTAESTTSGNITTPPIPKTYSIQAFDYHVTKDEKDLHVELWSLYQALSELLLQELPRAHSSDCCLDLKKAQAMYVECQQMDTNEDYVGGPIGPSPKWIPEVHQDLVHLLQCFQELFSECTIPININES